MSEVTGVAFYIAGLGAFGRKIRFVLLDALTTASRHDDIALAAGAILAVGPSTVAELRAPHTRSTAIHIAVFYDAVRVLQLLLASFDAISDGPTLRSVLLGSLDAANCTPLISALREGRHRCAQVLLTYAGERFVRDTVTNQHPAAFVEDAKTMLALVRHELEFRQAASTTTTSTRSTTPPHSGPSPPHGTATLSVAASGGDDDADLEGGAGAASGTQQTTTPSTSAWRAREEEQCSTVHAERVLEFLRVGVLPAETGRPERGVVDGRTAGDGGYDYVEEGEEGGDVVGLQRPPPGPLRRLFDIVMDMVTDPLFKADSPQQAAGEEGAAGRAEHNEDGQSSRPAFSTFPASTTSPSSPTMSSSSAATTHSSTAASPADAGQAVAEGGDVVGGPWSTAHREALVPRALSRAPHVLYSPVDLSSMLGGADLTPLHLSALLRNVVNSRLLLDEGANPHARDCVERTPMHMAALAGNAANLQLLVNAAGKLASAIAADAFGRLPLHCAASAGSDTCIQVMLEAGSLVDTKDGSGRSPLSLAAASGSLRAVQVLLAAGAAVDLQDLLGYTPLHYACRPASTFDPEIAYALVAAGADPYTTASSFTTPIHLASHTDAAHLQLVLLAFRARGVRLQPGDLMVPDSSRELHFPLYLSVHSPSCSRNTSAPAASDYYRSSSSSSSSSSMAATSTSPIREVAHESPTHSSSAASGVLTPSHSANVRRREDWGDSPRPGSSCAVETTRVALLAAMSDDALEREISSALRLAELDFLCDPRFPDSSLVHLASSTGNLRLLRIAAAVSQRGERAAAILPRFVAAPRHASRRSARGHHEMTAATEEPLWGERELVRRSPVLSRTTVAYGFTPLHLAACHGHLECVDFLLRQDAVDINGQDANNDTALHWAAFRGHVRIVERLLADARCRKDLLNGNRGTALHSVANLGCCFTASVLLESGLDPNRPMSDGILPLHNAVVERHVQLTCLLRAAGADPNLRNDKGETPLCELSKDLHGSAAVAMALLAPTPPTGFEQVLPMLRWLHAQCARWDAEAEETGDEDDPRARSAFLVPAAAPSLSLSRAKALGVDVVELDRCLAIGEAAHARLLASRGHPLLPPADPDIPRRAQVTPLHCAARARNAEVLRVLLAHGAAVNVYCDHGSMPLHDALASGSHACLVRLLRAGANVHALILPEDNPMPPLYYAVATNAPTTTLRALLHFGANVNQPHGHTDMTPLELACRSQLADVAKLLIESGALLAPHHQPHGVSLPSPPLQLYLKAKVGFPLPTRSFHLATLPGSSALVRRLRGGAHHEPSTPDEVEVGSITRRRSGGGRTTAVAAAAAAAAAAQAAAAQAAAESAELLLRRTERPLSLIVSSVTDTVDPLESMCLSESFADILVESSDGVQFPAHRVVLLGRCAYFAALLTSSFREAGEWTVRVDAPAASVAALLVFLYTRGALPPISPAHAEALLPLAALYNLPTLTSLLETTLETYVSLDKAPELWRVAQTHGLRSLANTIVNHLCSSEVSSRADALHCASRLGEILHAILFDPQSLCLPAAGAGSASPSSSSSSPA